MPEHRMRSLASVLGKILGGTEGFTTHLAAVVLSIVTLMMTWEIITRYIMDKPLFLAEQFIMLMMGGIVFLVLGVVGRRDEHIRIGFFISKLLFFNAGIKILVLQSYL